MMKKFTSLLFIFSALIFVGCSSAPTQTSLKNNNWRQNLLAIHKIKLNNSFTRNYKISPDGQKISWIGYIGADPYIFIKNLATEKNYQFKYFGDANYLWSENSESLLISKANNEYTSNRFDLLVVSNMGLSIKPVLAEDNYYKEFLGVSGNNKEEMMFSFYSKEHSLFHPDLYSININTGVKTLVARNDGSTLNWIYNEGGAVVATLDKLSDQYKLNTFENNKKSKSLLSCTAEHHLQLIGYAGNKINLLTDCFTDTQKVVSIDINSGEVNINPGSDIVDIDEVLVGRENNKPLLGYLYPDYQKEIFFSKDISDILNAFNNKKNVKIVSHTSDLSTVLVQTSTIQYRKVFLYSKVNGTKTLLSSTPLASEKDVVTSQAIQIPGHNNSPIYAYLSLPTVEHPQHLPLVVLIHGGPTSRDYYEYNSDIIFLASRGYAVLQVNYSGSTGYGLNYQKAGFKNIHRMKEDIEDAINWTITNNFADASNVALMGGSFGGYLALLIQQSNGLPVQPKCAISINAPTDIPQLAKESIAPFDETYAARYFGTLAQLSSEKNIIPSPIDSSSSGKKILLIQSKLDTVVNRAHAEKFYQKFSADNQIRFIELEKDSHDVDIWYNKLTVYREVEKFLSKNIGGSDNGFDYYYLGRFFY